MGDMRAANYGLPGKWYVEMGRRLSVLEYIAAPCAIQVAPCLVPLTVETRWRRTRGGRESQHENAECHRRTIKGSLPQLLPGVVGL